MSSGKRVLEGEVSAAKPKRKPRVISQKKWTTSEVNSILDYMIETILSNSEIEKPTAAAYYAVMNEKLSLQDVTPDKVRSKVMHLKNSYVQAVNWRNQTGQGIMEENGAEAVQSYLLKMCPNFDQLDAIYGCKANVNPPYVFDSGLVYDESSQDIQLQLIEVHEPESAVTINLSNEKEVETPEIELFKAKLKAPKPKHNKERPPKKDALTSFSEFQSKRTEFLEKKLSVEEKRLISEAEWKAKEFEQKDSKLKLEEKRIDNERELRMLEIEKDERIAMFRIEQEIKLKIELAKQKN